MQMAGGATPALPLIRDVPTIAALLTLSKYRTGYWVDNAILAGLHFLEKHQKFWDDELSEDLPVGIELIIPMLVAEVEATGLDLPTDHYKNLEPVAKQKIAQLESLDFGAATPPTFLGRLGGSRLIQSGSIPLVG